MSELTSAINVNINKEVKDEATNILNDLGLSMTSAISMFLTQVIRNEGIPFEVKCSRKPSRKLRKALKEAEAIASGKKKVKTYHNIDELFEALDID